MGDADGVGDLTQAQMLMTGLRHQAKGRLQRGSSQIAMAIGGPARFCRHAPSYKAISGKAIYQAIFISRRRGAGRPLSQADARLATRSSPYCGVMSWSIMARIIWMTAPRARALVAAWAAMLSVLSTRAASSALFSS